MVEATKENLDLWGDWTPVDIEEVESKAFSEPISGKYLCAVDSLKFESFKSKAGVDFQVIKMKLKIKEDIEGDISRHRMLDRSYFLGTSEWNDYPLNGYKQQLNNLYNAGYYEDWMAGVKEEEVPEYVEKIEAVIKDKTIVVTAFPKEGKQQTRIYKQKDVTEAPVEKSKFEV
jgi:hypothetical protein